MSWASLVISCMQGNRRAVGYLQCCVDTTLQDAKRSLIEALGLDDEADLERWQGKFRRVCEPKRSSGKLDVPEDIFEQYAARGASRDRLFEIFVQSGGDTEALHQTIAL